MVLPWSPFVCGLVDIWSDCGSAAKAISVKGHLFLEAGRLSQTWGLGEDFYSYYHYFYCYCDYYYDYDADYYYYYDDDDY